MAIHADWPAYPMEHGWQIAVISLGSFPDGTEFEIIDDIDRCALLLVKGHGSYKDPYDERAFHVAIWHEDLIEAHERGLVDGIEALTERQFEERKREELRSEIRDALLRDGQPLPAGDPLSALGTVVDGQFVRSALPPLDDYEDEDEDGIFPPDRSWLGLDSSGRVRLTGRGWSELDNLWADQLMLPEHSRSRVEPLIELELYDAALRELGVLMETRMREITSSNLYGQRLVDRLVEHLESRGEFLNTYLKILRIELRTAFKFIRNEFAHQVVDLPQGRALTLIGRMCHVLADLDEV